MKCLDNDSPPLRFLLGSLALTFVSGVAWPAVTPGDHNAVSFYGDFRARLEADWDSTQSDGVKRDDRDRLRTRIRFGMNWQATDSILVGFRLRSGSNNSQQSPNVTIVDFSGNKTGHSDVSADKWFVAYSDGGFSGWLGRNSIPFWKPDELLWDDDVTPTGLAMSYRTGSMTINTAYFSNPAGMDDFSGRSALAQFVYDTRAGAWELLFAAGVIVINADPNATSNALLLDNNGSRDYELWVANFQASLPIKQRKLRLNLNLYRNNEDYSASDPDAFTAFHSDQTDGYSVSGRLGEVTKGNWLFGYFYSHIETFAVNNSYSQDDWLRWGDANQTRASNFEGSEFQLGYGLGQDMNLMARFYVVDGINLRNMTSTTLEDGKRFRIDFNWRF